MIKVKRTDYKVTKNGVVNKGHECRYTYNDREIAWANEINDNFMLYLKTDYIGSDFRKSAYERATTCKYKDAYKELFELLGVDENCNVSEYTTM